MQTQDEPEFIENLPEADFAVPKHTDGANIKLSRAGGHKVLQIIKSLTPELIKKNQKFMGADELHQEMKKAR
ncbi:MAG: hypothetical protein LBH36_01495 [Candidatus Nomurabacteria bacterium]|jgi:hypothetical protein|nr:hypothetical protein [Candidatus Nomurabacteria bacterium]